MSSHYLLKCECGKTLRVEGRQAGESMRCDCGTVVRVPALRQLRRLPLAATSVSPSTTAWSQAQGTTFVTGIMVTAIALGVFFYFLPKRLGLDVPKSPFDRFLEMKDFNSLTAEDSWWAWRAYRHYDLRWGHTREYLRARQRAATLSRYLAIAAGAALVGGTIILFALLYLKPGRRLSRNTD